MSDLIGNPEDRFSHNEAQIPMCKVLILQKAILCMVHPYYIPLAKVPFSQCRGMAPVHPGGGQPVYRDEPGHFS